MLSSLCVILFCNVAYINNPTNEKQCERATDTLARNGEANNVKRFRERKQIAMCDVARALRISTIASKM